MASGERISNSLSQLETRPTDFGSSADLATSKDSQQPLQNEIGPPPPSDSIDNGTRKRSREWDRGVDVAPPPAVDEPLVKRRVTMSSIRMHETLCSDNRVEELSDDAGAGSAEDTEIPTQFRHSKTTSDPSSERRKTKRFRLTHNQTRFLMSEFTRQAHPDAAHRERLSREIPGLSPRQVQVWFQNRRAKLKRLTSQDRERMLKSRALPEDFDMGQVLNQPYSSRASDPSPLPAPHAPGSSFPGASMPKPLFLSASRSNADEYPMTTPTSAASIYGSYGPSPTSLNPLETSPLSRSDNRSLNSAPRARERASSQTDIGSLTRSQSFSSAYPRSWLPVQRLQLQQTDAKARDGSLGSPLRTSVSYSEGTARHENSGSTIPGIALGNGRSHTEPSPNSNDGATPHTAPLLSNLPYQNEQAPSSQSQSYSHQTQDDWRVNFNVGSNYRHVPSISSAPLSIPQDYQYSSFNQPFNFDSFYSYNQNNSSTMSLPPSNLRSDVDYEPPNSYNFNADDELSKPSGLPPNRH